MKHEDGNLVYSTESGILCTKCDQRTDQCRCKPLAKLGDEKKTVRLGFTSKGRKGKAATVLRGLRMAPYELQDFARQLKKKTGTGGASKKGIVEIQGDQRERIQIFLENRGWKVKRES